MITQIFTINAFSNEEKGGNPAGIVLNADRLTDAQMLSIAKRVGFSETAFLQKSNRADYKVKFFTPNREVDLCGHATIGSFSLLAQKRIIPPGEYTQETKAGVLRIEVLPDNSIFMEQNFPHFADIIGREAIIDSLNISAEKLLGDLPIQIVSTGLRDIFVPIISYEQLVQIKPDFDKIQNICRNLKVVGYHLFAIESGSMATAYCRNFAPLYGINEEEATGTSNGALSCYLFQYGKIEKTQIENLLFKQGFTVDGSSEIKAKLTIKDNRIINVRVGGTASNIKELIIEI